MILLSLRTHCVYLIDVFVHLKRINVTLCLAVVFPYDSRLMAAFYGDGLGGLTFPAKGKTSSLGLHANLPSLLIAGGLTLPLLLTSTGRRVYFGTWLYGTLLGWLWVLVRP